MLRYERRRREHERREGSWSWWGSRSRRTKEVERGTLAFLLRWGRRRKSFGFSHSEPFVESSVYAATLDQGTERAGGEERCCRSFERVGRRCEVPLECLAAVGWEDGSQSGEVV